MIVSESQSVAAGDTTGNVLAGLPEGLLTSLAVVSVRANHSGAARGDIRMDYFAGIQPKTGRNGTPVNVAATAGNIDARTDTIISRAVVAGQQSLIFRNTTAGALVVNWEYELHE